MNVFIHLPKTAGLSMNAILKKKWNKTNNYGTVHNMNSKEENNIKEHILDENYLLHGHISFKELSLFNIPTKNMFTVLRNPIDRCISWYYYTNKGKKFVGRELSLEDFFSSNNKQIRQNCYNRMTYQIGNYAHYNKRSEDEEEVLALAKNNIANFKFVIIFENLNEDLHTYLNIENIPHKNSTKKYDKCVDKEIEEKIRNWNKLDIELYNFVIDRLGDKYSHLKV